MYHPVTQEHYPATYPRAGGLVSWVLHPAEIPSPGASPQVQPCPLPSQHCLRIQDFAVHITPQHWTDLPGTGSALKSRMLGWYHSLLQASLSGPQVVSRISWDLASGIRNSPECFLIFHLA